MTKAFTYSATFKIARLDGANIREVTTGGTVRATDEIDVEAVAHQNFLNRTLPLAFVGYRVLRFPTETNGSLRISKASDAAFS